jgi:hypothetical protein
VRAILIALLLVNATAAAEVSATRLDGSTVSGELKGWDDKQAILVTGEGNQRIGVDELLSLRWQPGSPDEAFSAAAPSSQIELIDGSLLPIGQFRSSGTKAIVTPAGPTSNNAETLTLSKQQLAAVRLHALDAATAEQWQEIRELKPAADMLVLLKRDGKSLDYAEGVLGDVSPDKIMFELDGDAMKIDRDKVAGFIYFRRDAAKDPEPRFMIHGRTGLKANVARARLAGDTIELTTTGGAKLHWPLEDIYLADFSAGKLVYLSDLEPASNNATPLVALPAGASLAAKYAEPRRDHSAYGGALTLASADDSLSSPIAGTQTFNKGLAIRSRTELVYRLPAGYRRLAAIAGIDPATRASGNVRLEIFGDDRPLLAADIAGDDPPRTIDLDIAGVKRLKFVVDYGQNLDTGDWLNLCDLRIVK